MAAEPGLPEVFQARASLIASHLDLRNWPREEVIARMPLAIRVAGGGLAVLFRYGAVVTLGVAPEAENALHHRLLGKATHRYRAPDTEQLEIRVKDGSAEGLAEGALQLHGGGLERMQLIAEVLARSLLLAHYETRLAGEFDRIEPLALELDRRGSIRGGTREHLKRIGALLLVEHRMVGRAEIGEKPELVWEHPRLERLYALLEAEFEIRERLAALDRKLELASRTERTLVELISTRHALRVEWYIVALFVLEIALAVYGMAAK